MENMPTVLAKAQAPLHGVDGANSIEYMKAVALHADAATFLSRLNVDEYLRAGTLVGRTLSGQTALSLLQLVQPYSRALNVPAELLARVIAVTIRKDAFQA